MEILNNYLPTTYHKITASIITILLVQRIIKKLFFTRSVQQTFQSKRIIITGASSGIGEELAYQIVKNGAKSVSLCARRVEELQRVAKKCKELSPGVEANIIELDVTDLDSCKRGMEEAAKKMGGIDVLILNAGQTCLMRVKETDDITIADKVMRLNYLGYVYCTYYSLDQLLSSKEPIIIVNSSIAGIGWGPYRSFYSASKHALRGFFNSLRCEHPEIQITSVYPGYVYSQIHEKALREKGSSELQRNQKEFMQTDHACSLILKGVAQRYRDYCLTGNAYFFGMLPFLGNIVDKIAIKKTHGGFKKMN